MACYQRYITVDLGDGWLALKAQPGPIGEWPLAELVDGVFPDVSGHNNPALPDDPTAYVFSDGGTADGTPGEDNIWFPDIGPRLGDEWKIAFEFFPVQVNSAMTFNFPLVGGGTWYHTVSGLSESRWYPLAIEYDGTTLDIWRDDVLYHTDDITIDPAEAIHFQIQTNPVLSTGYFRNVKVENVQA